MDLGGILPDELLEDGFYDSQAVWPDEPDWLLPPTIHGEALPSVPVRVMVYLLNPNAQNSEAAIAYLEYAVSHREPGDEGLFKPDEAKPVLRPSMERLIDWIEETKRDEDNALPADEAALLEQIEAVRAAPDSWAITEIRLRQYKEIILPCLDMRLSPLLSLSAKQEGGVYHRLLQTALGYVEGDAALSECLDDLQAIAEE